MDSGDWAPMETFGVVTNTDKTIDTHRSDWCLGGVKAKNQCRTLDKSQINQIPIYINCLRTFHDPAAALEDCLNCSRCFVPSVVNMHEAGSSGIKTVCVLALFCPLFRLPLNFYLESLKPSTRDCMLCWRDSQTWIHSLIGWSWKSSLLISHVRSSGKKLLCYSPNADNKTTVLTTSLALIGLILSEIKLLFIKKLLNVLFQRKNPVLL